MQRRLNSPGAGSPPVVWVLLGPAHLRRCKLCVLLCRRSEHSASVVDNQGSGSTCANINTEQGHVGPVKRKLEFAFFLSLLCSPACESGSYLYLLAPIFPLEVSGTILVQATSSAMDVKSLS
jgi:hypothetical protein